MERQIRIAIDGPSGSGKSTLAKRLAARKGFIYVDTGAMYRAVALFFIRLDIPVDDVEKVEAYLPEISIELKYTAEGQRVFLNGEDVSGFIRTEQISMGASTVSKIPSVRAFLTKQQKAMAEKGGIVMDGRDIGTVVIPDAEVKIFMVTSPEERANRRYKELVERGEKAVYDDVLADIIRRDHNDSTREIAPLKAAEDAVVLDTSAIGIEETVEAALKIIEEQLQKRKV